IGLAFQVHYRSPAIDEQGGAEVGVRHALVHVVEGCLCIRFCGRSGSSRRGCCASSGLLRRMASGRCDTENEQGQGAQGLHGCRILKGQSQVETLVVLYGTVPHWAMMAFRMAALVATLAPGQVIRY